MTYQTDPGRPVTVSAVIVGNAMYTAPNSSQPAEACFRAAPTTSLLLRCPQDSARKTEVSSDVYDSKAAIKLYTSGAVPHDGYEWTSVTVWVDPTSALPIAVKETGTVDLTTGGENNTEEKTVTTPFSNTTTFVHDFVDRASLPKDMFDPAKLR
jgi:hypothetical protein